MPDLHYKSASLGEAKALDEGHGFLEGYGSVTGNIDRDNEIVEKGAVRNLKDFIEHGFSAIGHDWNDLPSGWIADAKEDDRGYWYKMGFHSTQRAQDARKVASERLSAGKSVALSIGYSVLEDTIEKRDGKSVRILKGLELHEISLVTVPANPQAMVTRVKAGLHAGLSLEDHLETALAAVSSAIDRAEKVKAMREDEGRQFSDQRLDKVKGMRDRLDAFIDACKSSDDPETADEALAELARHEAFMARQQGLVRPA